MKPAITWFSMAVRSPYF